MADPGERRPPPGSLPARPTESFEEVLAGAAGIQPCECGHSWAWHRAPEAMGRCQFPTGYQVPFGGRLPLGLRPIWRRVLDGCQGYRPRTSSE